MPTIPKVPRTISQIIPSQLPDFVQDDYPMFVSFLKAYYEWLETFGTQVWTGKVVGTSINTVTLTNATRVAAQNAVAQASAPIATTVDQVATYLNAYKNMFIVCLNGPAKGHTHKIAAYDPTTWTVTLFDTFDPNNIPPPNTLMEIRDSYSPEKLLEYRDIDYTLDRFIQYFRDEFMYLIPGNILVNPREILKHIKEFYQAKGTENSFRFIFRCLFGEEIEFYYPKVDLLRASDAIWSVQNVMKMTTTGLTFDYLNRVLTGVASGATASVESVTQQVLPQGTISTLTLSNINGQFQMDPATGLPEQVKISYNVPPPPQTDLGSVTDLLEAYTQLRYESTYQLLQQLLISEPGDNYQVGETITISGGGELTPATSVITSIFQTYYTGSCSIPPSVYYLEPYFGPATTPINADGNPMDDAVCIPGMYFWADVHSTYTDADLLNPNQVMLSSNEVSTDNFFVGDEISFVGGTGVGERGLIVSYNGTTKVATVASPFMVVPDGTTQYSITHIKGGIKSVAIIDFGLGFVSTPTVTINTVDGSGAVLPPNLGIVAQTAGQWLPGRPGGVGGFPTTTDSLLNSNKVIQDSYYWQDFSYDLQVGETIDKYRDAVKALLHPAGMMMFGSVMLYSKPDTNFLEILRQNILEFDALIIDTKLKVFEERIYHTMHLNTIDPAVVGMKNKDFDWMKFIAFPPNVEWDTLYPYPNENYWTPTGPGNTQIANLMNRTIGSFVNFPDQRTKISPDANIQIQNSNSYSLVGPIGQSRAAISQFRFVGFPPFEGFDESYPSPNDNYWSTSFGNTQIGSIKDIVLFDLIVAPDTKHSNICVDSDFTIYVPGTIPRIGEVVEYNFLEGIDPQIVYNVSPNSIGEYDGVLGNTILVETIDGTWVATGVQLDSSQNEIVNATGVPLNLSQCTVLVIAMCPDVSTDMSIINCINSTSDNGFSVDVRTGGGVSFRVQYDSEYKTAVFPSGTITDNNYFMAALRFDRGKLSGNISNSQAVSVTFSNYPSAPVVNTSGWYFGKSTVSYVDNAQSSSLFSKALFGKSDFKQAAVSGSPVSVGYFNGVLAYAIFYDRPLFDFEIDSAYEALREMLAEERGISLQNTISKNLLGNARIKKTGEQQTIGGAYWIVKRKTLTGVSRIQRTRTYTQSGTFNVYTTSQQHQSGTLAIRGGGIQTQTGISRIELITNRLQAGVARIQATTQRPQYGTTAFIISSTQTQAGVSRIELITNQTQTGVARIRITTQHTQSGITRFWYQTNRTQAGISRIQPTTVQILNGNSAIQGFAVQVQQGISRFQRASTKTQTGVSNFLTLTTQTQMGVSHIT